MTAIRGRRFTAAGVPNGAEFVVTMPSFGVNDPIALSVLDDDRFLVVYAQVFPNNIYGKLYGPTAATDATAAEFRVNSAAGGVHPSAIALSNRNMFVLWESNRMRRLDIPAVP